MTINDFWIPFLSIAAAELGDKTQLGVMLLASKTKQHTRLFLGVMAGFLFVDGLAILFGAALTKWIPAVYLKWAAGLLFIAFGVLMLVQKEKKEDTEESKISSKRGPFWLGFFMIGTAEWGDKTQIACAMFASQFHPAAVFVGAMAALAFLSIAAILAGGWISKKVPEKMVHRAAGILFALIGLGCLLAR